MKASAILDKLRLIKCTHGATRRGYPGPALAVARPLDEATIAAFEAEHRIKLPGEYRSFLLEVGNGGDGPGGGLSALAPWEMDGFARVEVTITGEGGMFGSTGTGDRPAVARRSDPSRPFLLTGPWTPFGAHAEPSPLPLDSNPYDGCVHLAEMGCGYFHFLVVTGAAAGQVWHDYTAGDGEIGPAADSFGRWYEDWLDGTLAEWVLGSVISDMDRMARWTPSDEALRAIRLGERRAKEQDAYWLHWLGHARLYERRLDDAERLFVQLATTYPEDIRSVMGLCRVQLERGDGIAALRAADAGLGRDELDSLDRAALLRLRARSLRSLGRLRDAIRAARDSIETPAYGVADGYFALAALQVEAHDRKGARKTIARAKDTASLVWAGSGEVIRGRKAVEDAFADFCAWRR